MHFRRRTIADLLAQQGKNDKLIREWDILKTAYRAVGTDEFYLEWGQTVSGRSTILNDIQYQESKLQVYCKFLNLSLWANLILFLLFLKEYYL